jgi:hypothetical protein
MNKHTLDEARAAKARALKMFSQLTQVAGVGITTIDGGYGVRVNLREAPAAGVELPEAIDGVPVEVRVVGGIRKAVDPLKQLKQQYPEIRIPLNDKEIDPGMSQLVSDLGKRLLTPAAARIGIDPEKLQDRLTFVYGELSHSVNGYVRSFDNGCTFEIVLNVRLMIFLHKMVKVFVASVGVRTKRFPDAAKPKPFGRIVSACKDLMDAFWEGRLHMQKGFWLAELGRNQIDLSEMLLQSCECFCLAHELGHIVIALSKEEVPEYAPARKLVEDFLHLLSELNEREKDQIVGPWTQEICADLIGLQLVLAQSSTRPYNAWDNFRQFLYGGAEAVLIFIGMLQEYYDKMHHGSKMTLVNTHPPALLRLKAIRSSPERTSFVDDAKIGGRCGVFATKVLSKVCGKSRKRRSGTS